jgi:hypothetical protein
MKISFYDTTTHISDTLGFLEIRLIESPTIQHLKGTRTRTPCYHARNSREIHAISHFYTTINAKKILLLATIRLA